MTSNILLQMGHPAGWGHGRSLSPLLCSFPRRPSLPFPSCRAGLEVDAINAPVCPSHCLPLGSGEQSYALWEQGTEEAQGIGLGRKANRVISLKGRCLPRGEPHATAPGAESIAWNMPLSAYATSLPRSQCWGGRRVGNDGASLLRMSPGSLAGTASPSTRLQPRCGAALLGNGLTSLPLTPSGRQARTGAWAAREY